MGLDLNSSFYFSRNTKITAVDIDEAILDIAKTYFGLPQSNDKLNVAVTDGLEYLKTKATDGKTKFNAILFDVDSKDSSVGISCPPKQFLEPETIQNVKSCLADSGMFVLNLVCRDDKLRAEIKESLSRSFPCAVGYKLEEEVNEVVFCKNSGTTTDLRKELKLAMDSVNVCIKKQKLNNGDLVDVEDIVKQLTTLAV